MDRKDLRQSGKGYNIEIKQINGVLQEDSTNEYIDIDNISKGGFRFTTSIDFELEDRIQVVLNFPDNTTKEVFGRICYSELIDKNANAVSNKAYGFSILLGFYELPA